MDITPKSKKAMTKDEVALLVDLVNSKPVLTSKETNASTNKSKEEAWVALTSKFNATSGQIPRHKEQLKLKWDNLKKAARKRAQLIRKNNLQTGGGKPDFIPPDEILEKVAGLMGSTCTGFEVPFGGDGVGINSSQEAINVDATMGEDIYILPLEAEVVSECKTSLDIATPINEAKKRKFQTGIYGMTKMAKELQTNIGRKKKKEDNGQRERNLAVADYYKTKRIKLDLEIEILKLELAAKRKLQEDSDNNV
ncbi:unnamed protein product [Euphydryas editha]|uniref:Regulatory protein zeste n=1 Tax=Euphydryas editha TaxID=104508 RepID=A0AAU9V257_EUPED|nr:unnamed protein product [Euphydryas editha]